MAHRSTAVFGFIAALGIAAVIQQGGRAQVPGQSQPGQIAPSPARDTSGLQSQGQTTAIPATGRITGRVVAADTGRPLRGARVQISAPQSTGRSLVTDGSGMFDFSALPEGRYSLNVSKSGFINLAYGQRRPLQPGTPLQLSNGQKLEGIEMRLPRGSAITGHVMDENGDALPNLMVRVMRFQYQQGERRLVPAGGGQTDDRGQYRVWGLNPGDYYVSAVMPNLGNVLDQLGGPGFGPGGRGGRGGRGGPGGPPGPGGRQGPGGATDPSGAPGGAGRGRAAAQGAQGAVAIARGVDISAIVTGALADPGTIDTLNAAGLGNFVTMFAGQDASGLEAVAYAPTYFPGVASVVEARPVSVPLGGEAAGIDFSLLVVQTARVAGRVANPDGSAATAGVVNLFPDQPGGRGGFGENFSGRVQSDGAFTIANVPPGRYILRARGNIGGPAGRGGRGGNNPGRGQAPGTAPTPPQQFFASQSVMLSGGETTDLTVALAPGATLSGTISLPPAQAGSAINLSQVRIMAQATESSLGTNMATAAQSDGTFTLENVPPGTHWLRGQAPRGLTLKSVMVGGRDVIDEPYEVRGGDQIGGVTLVFTDKASEINGTVTDDRGAPVTDYTVLAFAEDSRLWRPQSRQIMTARPDQNGKYQIRGLPPGRYYLATVDPEVAGEWFEPGFLEQHRTGAASLSLSDGEIKTQDFRLR